MGRPLDGDEEALGGLLARTGSTVRAARVFAALARGGGHTATDLAAVTGLTRQEAGDAARELEAHGLARVEKVPSGGRPTLRYHLVRERIPTLVEERRWLLETELAALKALEEKFA